jgi:hypothetical protein
MTLLESAAAQHDIELAEAIERRKAQVSVPINVIRDIVIRTDSVADSSGIPGEQLKPQQRDQHWVQRVWRSDQSRELLVIAHALWRI